MAEKLPSDDLALSLQEFINFWRGGHLRFPNRGKIVAAPYHKAVARVLRKIMSMMGHFAFEHNPDLKRAIEKSLRQEPKLKLSDWKVLLWTIKVHGTPYEGHPTSIFTSQAVEEVSGRYAESLAQTSTAPTPA